MTNFLRIESIWEDDDLFEVRVSASNGLFSAVSNCYTNRGDIAELANLIEGFPKRIGQEVYFSTGEGNDLSFFSLRFKCKDLAGHSILRVKIAHIISYANAEKEHYTSEFDLEIEAAAIDNFTRSVDLLSRSKLGEVQAT